MSDSNVTAIKDILNDISDKFSDLIKAINQLPPQKQREYLNPENLGAFSNFLEIGNGWEPGVSHQSTMSDLIDDIKDISDNSTDDEIEDEVEEACSQFLAKKKFTNDFEIGGGEKMDNGNWRISVYFPQVEASMFLIVDEELNVVMENNPFKNQKS